MLEPGLTQRRSDRSGADDRNAHECLPVFQASSDPALCAKRPGISSRNYSCALERLAAVTASSALSPLHPREQTWFDAVERAVRCKGGAFSITLNPDCGGDIEPNFQNR